MKNHHIRRVKAQDLPDLLEMIQALAAHHGDVAATTLEDLDRDLMGRTPWATALVAPAEAELMGYAVLCPLMQLQFGVRGMDMHHLFIRPAYRRQGVGKALIDASIAEVKWQKCRYLTVGTHPENTAAAAYYRAAGFAERPPPGPRFAMRL